MELNKPLGEVNGTISCLILPHGAMVFDGMANNEVSKEATKRIQNMPKELKFDCTKLYEACLNAVKIIRQSKPDLVMLNTPHGISLSDSFGVYMNETAKGCAEWNGEWKEFNVNIKMDSDIAKKLLHHFRNEGIPSEGITAFSATDMPLRWGEVIPLWFLQELTSEGTRVVIFTNPSTLVKGAASVEERVNVGVSIAKFIRTLPMRVLYVVSGDLAHTHKSSCQIPVYLPDPRWSMPYPPNENVPIEFDMAIENWMRGNVQINDTKSPVKIKSTEEAVTGWNKDTIQNSEKWLIRATELKNLALSCGIYGFGILHGILESDIALGYTFQSHFLCRLAPTYYGMIVAAFVKQKAVV